MKIDLFPRRKCSLILSKILLFSMIIIVSACSSVNNLLENINAISSEENQPSESISKDIPLTTLIPKSTTNIVVSHNYFILSYNETYEQSEWVFYEITSKNINGAIHRTNDFRKDPFVETGTAENADYSNSGYDRGHLVPAADMAFSDEAMSESFFHSNISPQDPGFNRGIWSKLETKIRDWASDKGKLYVATGGILKDNLTQIGPNLVSVPNSFFKVILHIEGDVYKTIAFILPNENSPSNLSNFVTTVDQVELETGLDFFESVTANIESEMESSVDSNFWLFDETATEEKEQTEDNTPSSDPTEDNTSSSDPTEDNTSSSDPAEDNTPSSDPTTSISIFNVDYNPPGSDFERENIVLINSGSSSVDLTNWYFVDNSNSHHEIVGTVGPSQKFVIARNKDGYQSWTGKTPNYATEFALSNTSDFIKLYSPTNKLVDEISWEN